MMVVMMMMSVRRHTNPSVGLLSSVNQVRALLVKENMKSNKHKAMVLIAIFHPGTGGNHTPTAGGMNGTLFLRNGKQTELRAPPRCSNRVPLSASVGSIKCVWYNYTRVFNIVQSIQYKKS